ncbi:MAG: hypothetical protein JWQ98_2872 [Chlorobi bacterium]|nr:hypothetical protein [Chlorobiota bacterium]
MPSLLSSFAGGEDRLAVTRAYYASAYARKQMRRTGAITLPAFVFQVLFFVFFCKAFFGFITPH